MVVENFDTFVQWLLPNPEHYGALIVFLMFLAVGTLAGIVLGYLVAAFRHGPGEGFYVVASVIADAIPDFLKLSPRRVLAMARLAVKESIRARVIVAFIVFAIVLLYARWFLDVKSDHPGKLLLAFVMNSTTFLVLIMAVFLSTFSLPSDIKNRTIYTVVTKPVRSSEIVLGRMLGFCFMGTAILLAMGVVSYFFVVRGLSHTHQLDADPDEIAAAVAADGGRWTGQTELSNYHRHDVTIDSEGEVFDTEMSQGHRHEVTERDGQYVVGPPVDQLQARVPHYGKLRFLDRAGSEGEGINVGKEWNYRRYIEGQTLAAGVWTMEDVRPERFHDELPIELTLRVFRTFKGDIVTGVKGSITLRNPDPASPISESVPITFISKEFETDLHIIPRKIQAIRRASGTPVPEADVFEDLCDENGRLEIRLRCEDRSQYFGLSQGDLYLLEAQRPFWLNFCKGYLGIWMQMVLVTTFGVAVSTLLNGAVSMLATVAFIVIGFTREQTMGVFKGVWNPNEILTRAFGEMSGSSLEGGGPLESVIRLLTQKNLSIDLDYGWFAEGIIKWVDIFLMGIMALITHMVPDFTSFNTARHVAEGYNISGHLMGQQLATCLTFVGVFAVIGYFLLKTREIAAE